jgi:hypothetical protein
MVVNIYFFSAATSSHTHTPPTPLAQQWLLNYNVEN